eukprot:7993539-Pyramimonas_sp.AAC.1
MPPLPRAAARAMAGLLLADGARPHGRVDLPRSYALHQADRAFQIARAPPRSRQPRGGASVPALGIAPSRHSGRPTWHDGEFGRVGPSRPGRLAGARHRGFEARLTSRRLAMAVRD